MLYFKSYRHLLSLIVATIITSAMFFVVTNNISMWLGILVFTLYIVSIGFFWQHIFERVFGIYHVSITNIIYSYLSVLLLLGFFSSICLVWYRITPEIIFGVYVVVAFFSYGLLYMVRRVKSKTLKVKSSYRPMFGMSVLPIIIYFIGWFSAMYLLLSTSSEQTLYSPWENIPRMFLPLFFVLTIFVGILIFSKHKTNIVLGIIIAHSFLLHAYIPTSHELPFGGDVWRIFATEEKLANSESILPVLFGDEKKTLNIFGLNIPEALLIPHKYTYGHLWGTTVLLNKTIKVSLIGLNKWLVSILWSLVIPIILFRFGLILFKSRRIALIFVWLSFIPFPFHALGSLTLPVSLGYISFFFLLSLWFQFLKQKNPWQRNIVFIFAFLMLFGYALHFLLIWFVIAVSYLLEFLENKSIFRLQTNSSIYIKRTIRIFIFTLSIFVIPIVEWFGVKGTKFSSNIFLSFKQIVGQLSGWFYASAIRSHDIVSGNIIFNHTPSYAFYDSVFTQWRWYIIPILVVMWVLVLLTIINILFYSRKLIWKVYIALFLVGFGGYIVGWVVLNGDRLFTRRLDALLSFLILIAVTYGFTKLKKYWFRYLVPGSVLIFIFILSWFATGTFASGPDLRVVSLGEYRTAEYIFSSLNKELPICVLSDTWTLLALEGVSAGSIVGGGFPIEYDFAQPGRTELFSSFVDDTEGTLERIKSIHTADLCYVAVKNLNIEEKVKITDFLQNKPIFFDEMTVWEVDLKKH